MAKTLNTDNPNVPKMGTALPSWSQKITFVKVTKQNINFEVVETEQEFNFKGVWQPFSPQQLLMKPTGQRAWKWFTVHALIDLPLKPDEIVYYKGVRYRVKDKLNYKEYNYYEYHLIQDYQTPEAPEPEEEELLPW